MSINEKLHLLHNKLQQFKTAFSDSEEITLIAAINQNHQSKFRDYSQLVDHFRQLVLPICDSSPFYVFQINFQSENDGAADFIAQILQLPQINRCQEVSFFYSNETFIQLPVEVIANWLNRNSDDGIGCTATGQSKKRYLCMNYLLRIQNAAEMCDRMKTVFLFIYFISSIKIVFAFK